jgi:hypothetical protein
MTRSRFRPSGRTEVKRLRRQLDDLFERGETETDPGTSLEGDFNRYLCVRICGFLEQGVASCCRALVEEEARNHALAFGLSWLKRPGNPRVDNLLQLVGRFNATWRKELEELLANDERDSRINALVGIRNDVAHGKNQGVSRAQAFEYYELADEVIDFFLERFDPVP